MLRTLRFWLVFTITFIVAFYILEIYFNPKVLGENAAQVFLSSINQDIARVENNHPALTEKEILRISIKDCLTEYSGVSQKECLNEVKEAYDASIEVELIPAIVLFMGLIILFAVILVFIF